MAANNSKTDVFENNLLALIFNNAPIVFTSGDATNILASATPGHLYVSLHTATPDETGDQTANETAYTNYTRVGVTRDTSGWTVSGSSPTQVVNAALVPFAQCGASGATITHIGIGSASSGAGKLLYYGQLVTPLTVSNGVTPQFNAGDLKVTED